MRVSTLRNNFSSEAFENILEKQDCGNETNIQDLEILHNFSFQELCGLSLLREWESETESLNVNVDLPFYLSIAIQAPDFGYLPRPSGTRPKVFR